MTLTVETGTGSSTADSYVSLADANTYVESYTEDDDWLDSLEDQRERALRLATQAVDRMMQGRWQGYPSSSTQALAWPRTDVEVDRHAVLPNEIPEILKRATIELAIRFRRDPATALIPDDTEPGTIVEESIKVGPIAESIRYGSGGKGKSTEYRLVEAMLSHLTIGGSGSLNVPVWRT